MVFIVRSLWIYWHAWPKDTWGTICYRTESKAEHTVNDEVGINTLLHTSFRSNNNSTGFNITLLDSLILINDQSLIPVHLHLPIYFSKPSNDRRETLRRLSPRPKPLQYCIERTKHRKVCNRCPLESEPSSRDQYKHHWLYDYGPSNSIVEENIWKSLAIESKITSKCYEKPLNQCLVITTYTACLSSQ